MSVDLMFSDGVAQLTLNRPEKLNALSFQILGDIAEALEQVGGSNARALIVTGAGDKAFCAGADIEELQGRRLAAQRDGARLGQTVFQQLADLRIVSIAAINGYAFGGGLELALACTFRVASPNARFGLPEIKLGLIPGYGGTQRLPRLVGQARALDMILSGRTVSAEEALSIGLVEAVERDDLIAGARAFAARFTSHSLPVVALARDAVVRGGELPLSEGLKLEADLSTLAYQTDDAEEGLAAFVAKRAPEFQDG